RSRPRLPSSQNRKRSSTIRKEKEKSRKYRDRIRAQDKAESFAAKSSAFKAVRERPSEKYVAASDPLPTATDPESCRVASNMFTALHSKIASALRLIRFKDIPGPGAEVRVIKWRGSRPLPLLDNAGRTVGLGAAHSRTLPSLPPFHTSQTSSKTLASGASSQKKIRAGASTNNQMGLLPWQREGPANEPESPQKQEL
ncbi:hypothetical protein DXG01_010283, partial [Tephrocybe rancida]